MPGSGGGLALRADDELERIETRVEELLQRYAELRRVTLELRVRQANLCAENAAAVETVMARLTLEEHRALSSVMSIGEALSHCAGDILQQILWFWA